MQSSKKITKGELPLLTTSDVTEVTDKKYVTDAELVVIGNTSGTNTGDQDLSGKQDTISIKYKVLPITFDFTSVPIGYDNSTWIIRHDFNLNGASIALPTNVTLSFEGGSITNGSIVFDNTTIDYKNVSSVLADVVLTGTITNGTLDVRLFGILPNDNLLDATVLYDTNLVSLDVVLFFPRGNYYFSELHVTKHFFRIVGEESNDLEVRTIFHPFNASQYYIIKIGGSKFTLNDAAFNFAKNSSIVHIWFTTPLGFTGLNLPFPDATITNLNYKCSALILDQAQGGRFAINGHTLHNMPLLSIGFAYELYFDYIKMQGNHGKSDLPVIQITNNYQAGQYISASVIHQLWVDIMVGPVFAMSGLAGMNEFAINNVYIEGTIEWEQESIFAENRFTRLTKTLPEYYTTVENIIPMFSIGGITNMTIGSMFINGTDTEWQNSLDPVPLGWNTRSFFKMDTVISDIKIGSVSDGAWGQNMLLEGAASAAGRNTFYIGHSTPEIAYYNQVADNFDFISDTNNIRPQRLKSNLEYSNDDFSLLLETKFLTNIGLDNPFITPDEPNYKKVIQTRWDNYILNQSGFYIDGDKIEIVGKTASGSNVIDVEYYDASNVLLSTQNYSAAVTPNVLFNNVITLTKPVNYSYLKLKHSNAGYFLNIYSLTAVSSGNVIDGTLTVGVMPKASGTKTLSDSIVTDNGTGIVVVSPSTPYVSTTNGTNFLNTGIDGATSFLNSSRGFDFITDNSTIPLRLLGQNIGVGYSPDASTGGYEVLTRNTTTGTVEKKPSTFFQTALTNPITGSLTVLKIPVATGGTGLIDGILSDNGSNIGLQTASTPYLNITDGIGFVNYGILTASGNSAFWNTDTYYSFLTNSGEKLRIDNSGNLSIYVEPTTSTGTYDILTRNTTSGVVEKVTATISGTNTGDQDLSGLQPLLTNPITGTGTTNYLSKFTGASALGNSVIYDNGTNVGIGTTSPLYKLDLVGNDINSGLGFSDGTSRFGNIFKLNNDIYFLANRTSTSKVYIGAGTAESYPKYLTIDGSTGNVGIGTTTPVYKLEVIGSAKFGASGVDGDVNLYFQSQNNFSNGLNIFKRGSDSDINGSVMSGAELGYHSFYGWDGSAYRRGAYVLAKAAENWNATSRGTYYRIATTPNGSTISTVALTVLGNGNVLIGTTVDNGADKLQVVGSIKATSSVQVGDNALAASASNVGAIRYRTSGNNSYSEMCMQTGASTYAWITMIENNW